MPLVVAIAEWWGWFPYFGNDDGEKIEKYSYEIEVKKYSIREPKENYEENMELNELVEWFEQNIKNMNELDH